MRIPSFARGLGRLLPCARVLSFVLALAGSALAQSYTFTTFAGILPQKGSADGTARDARFSNPGGVTLDSAGNLYVADTLNYTIRKIAPDGSVTTLAGRVGVAGNADGTGDAARFGQLYGLAADAAGNVFVADYENHAIRKITPAGLVSTFAGVTGIAGSVDGTGSAARFRNPVGVVVDPAGNLFVTDRGNRIIRKITPEGVTTTFAGLFGVGGSADGPGPSARFNALAGIGIDSAANLYVTDTVNHTIRKITPDGTVSTVAGASGLSGSTNGRGTAARFNLPNSVAADSSGNLYVADTLNELIRKITPDGTVSIFSGTTSLPGSTDGLSGITRFYRPYSVIADPAGNVYVADTDNHSIRKLTSAGTSSVYAGPGGNFGAADGPAASARFNLPGGIATDRAGNVYVTDSGNYTVRKITPAGFVTTIAGETGVPSYIDGVGPAARFAYPFGIAADGDDNLFVVDSVFNVIRKLTPATTVSTYAGVGILTGSSLDGPALSARFNIPRAVASDRSGNLYVTDWLNQTIRRISTSGQVTTLAGGVGLRGTADGTGTAARFSDPQGLACDNDGNVYVADTYNYTIRKITPDGVVTTLAGLAGTPGTADGNGPAARFYTPSAIVVGPQGNLFVADVDSGLIRLVTPSGVVTTIAGQLGMFGGLDGTGTAARFTNPSGLTFDASGNLFIVDSLNNRIVKGVLDTPPTVTPLTRSLTLASGSSVTLAVSATGGGLSYQWRFNGASIPGANSPTYTVLRAGPTSTGDYTVRVTNSAGTIVSDPIGLNVITTPNVGRITNLAIRSSAGTGAQTLIVGVAIGGTGTGGNKPILLRAVGPTLSAFGVPGALVDPKLELFAGATKTNENDDWAGNAQVAAIGADVGAFALSAPTSKDAALYSPAFTGGAYSVQITGGGGASGVALAEIYDATPTASFGPTTPRLTNVSARTQVGTESDILIAGFTIGGITSKTILLRAIGPTLVTFGVTGALADPKLTLYSGTQKIDENDDWGGAAATTATFFSVGAFPLAAASHDAVLLVTLPPGSYTAQVSGANTTTGVALVEIYEVP